MIGEHSIVHIHSSIGHHAKIGRHCIILPGARISGNVELKNGVLIGSNSFVARQKTIGEYSQVDAMTYVDKDLPSGIIKTSRAKYLIDRKTLKPVKRS